jgi:hypothetical protein
MPQLRKGGEWTMKRGDTFLHRYWLAEDRTPLRCIVTAVRNGVVYWKQVGERKAKMCFDLSNANKYVMPNAPRQHGPAPGDGLHADFRQGGNE